MESPQNSKFSGMNTKGTPVAANLNDIEGAIERAMLHLRGVHQIRELTFGLDPGPRPGVAWMGDGVLLGMAQLESIEDVVGHIRSIERAIEHHVCKVRIGNGAPLIRDHIINNCIADNIWGGRSQRGAYLQRPASPQPRRLSRADCNAARQTRVGATKHHTNRRSAERNTAAKSKIKQRSQNHLH